MAGHDHKADFRFHTVDDNKQDFFLNKILFPSLTPNASSQPAFSTFQFDTDAMTFENLEITYLRLTETHNLPRETPITQLPTFTVNFEEKFGLKDFSGAEMFALQNRLVADL